MLQYLQELQNCLPGRNPGTSTNVIIGILKASQNLTNRAPLTDELISRQPEKHANIIYECRKSKSFKSNYSKEN